MHPQRFPVRSSLIASIAVLVLVAGPVAFAGPGGGNKPIGRTQLNAVDGPIETDGAIDLPFDAGAFGNGWIVTSALQPDHKLLIGGLFRMVHGVSRRGIARLNEDGTLDQSFDLGTADYTDVEHFVVLSDGKIMVFGHTWPPDLFPPIAVLCARLNSDGSVDPTFRINRVVATSPGDDGAGNAMYPGTVRSVVEQDDGKLIVVGSFSYVITGPGKSVARGCIARFNPDGSFDASFDPGTGFASVDFYPEASRVMLQRNGVNHGKVIVQGHFGIFDEVHSAYGMVRLTSDGSYDESFGSYDGVDDSSLINGIFLQSNDQIVVFGSFSSAFKTKFSGIVRLTNNGFLDPTFVPDLFDDYGNPAVVSAVAQQSSGRLIVGGYFHSLNSKVANNVVRLEADGSRDISFDGYATGPSGYFVDTIVVRPDSSKIFVAGYFSSYQSVFRNNMAWLNPAGSVDGTFAGMSGVNDYAPQIYALGVQSDGKILVGGIFSSVAGTSHYNIVRLNPDSTIDSSFATQGTDGSVRALRIQPDGKILIAGNIQAVDGTAYGRIARLNSDGTLDSSFNPGTGADGIILGLALDLEGNIYVGGGFMDFNGTYTRRVAKLDPSGQVDPMFIGDASDLVYTITPPDEAHRIMVGGSFRQWGLDSARYAARVDAVTGELDLGFRPPLGGGFNNFVRTILPTSNGKYYFGGDFTRFDATLRTRIARLNSDGSLDSTFVGPANLLNVFALAEHNGKLFAGGYGYVDYSGLVRLTDSGEPDATFKSGTIALSPPYFANPTVSALATQSDGKLIVGGVFNQYNGNTRGCLARLGTVGTGVPGFLGNISTRLRVENGDNSLVGGLIITGTQPKKIIVRAIGPSLSSIFSGTLTDPFLELHDSSGALIASNDNWRSNQEQEIIATLIPPSNDLESAIVVTLPANGSAYTAVVHGANNETGVGIVEAYDLDQSVDSKLANISTRGFVQTNNDVLIGGVIVLGQTQLRVLARAIGPSLPIGGALGDPMLELHNGDGVLIVANDNWRNEHEAEIIATGIPPTSDLESAVVRDLAPGNYTAIVRGVNDTTGVALVEVYALSN